MAGQAERIAALSRVSMWSEDEAREVLALQEASGQCAMAFCREVGLVPERLYAWRRKLAQRELPNARFTPVRLVGPSPTVEPESAPLEVVLGDGTRVVVRGDFDAKALRRLLSVLGAARC